MTDNIEKIAPGDDVTIFGTARSRLLPNGVLAISITTSTGNIEVQVPAREIATWTPKPFAAGDRVVFIGIHGERNLQGTVIALNQGRAWVEWDSVFPHDIVVAAKLERVR